MIEVNISENYNKWAAGIPAPSTTLVVRLDRLYISLLFHDKFHFETFGATSSDESDSEDFDSDSCCAFNSAALAFTFMS